MIIPKNWPDAVSNIVQTAAQSGRVSIIREALRAIRALPDEQQGALFKLGICRTFTVETQLDAITLGLATLPCRPSLILGDLDNIEQVLLNPESLLLKAKPHALLILWRLEEIHPRLAFEHNLMSEEERKQAINHIVNRVRSLCNEYSKISSIPLFLSTLPEQISFGMAVDDVYSSHSPRMAILKINQVLLELTASHALLHIFDFSGWTACEKMAPFDLKMDMYARQPISSSSVMSFSETLANSLRPLLQPPAKVIAIDLDNVLWGGILGEDGVGGLKVGHDFPGNVYLRIQRHLLALRSRGVLLVLLSKNNLEDVRQAFSVIDMPLKLNDFSAVRVNWQEKSANIRDVAQELNLGLSSFVFVDDQAFEREQMNFHAPEVQVLSISEDPLQILRSLMKCHLFDSYRVSAEDRERSLEYAAQEKRRVLESENKNSSDFLYTLQLQAQIERVNESTIPRVVQLLGKTNQFNVTTRRHTESDVREMLNNPDNIFLTISLKDCFGNQGLVGLAIALGDHKTKTAKIDSFLLSCRAIGRGAENVLYSYLLLQVSSKGYALLQAEYRRTEKNSQVSDLFERFGMAKQKSETDGCSQFVLSLPNSFHSPDWIDVTEG